MSWGCKVQYRRWSSQRTICIIHGHEKRGGDCLREWGVLGGGGQRGKNWDKCNSMINKYN